MQDHQYRRLAWLGLTGISTGAGIWSTHFVAMLAYDFGFPTAYDPTLTLASLVIAIGVTTIGYLISVDGKDCYARTVALACAVHSATCLRPTARTRGWLWVAPSSAPASA